MNAPLGGNQTINIKRKNGYYIISMRNDDEWNQIESVREGHVTCAYTLEMVVISCVVMLDICLFHNMRAYQ